MSEALFPHQHRVVLEKQDLDDKLQKLMSFISSPAFIVLDAEERRRLEEQALHMTNYSRVLGERIAAF